MLSIFPCNCLLLYLPCFSTYPPWSSLDILASWNSHKPRQETLEIWEIDGTWPNCEKAYPQTRRPEPNAHKKRLCPGYGRSHCFIFPPATAPRICDHVRKIGLSNIEQNLVASAWSSNFQAERAQCHCASLRHSAANAMYMSHLTIWHKASSGCYYTCHTLDNSWTESPLHRHDRGTPPADEGVICTQIRWKPLQSPRWNAICFAHTAWTPWWSDFPLGSDQARNKVRVWLRLCWKGQADPKFGCLINKD